ncbi:hypothetical protein FACS1894195_0200 [Bacteroidia bacterium]|nr:hypothetical protein FACS1894195_0200 [Bacteroidia bacterium]
MNAVTLDTQKIALAREILEEPNENIIMMVMTYFRAIKDDTIVVPCHFSVEELKTEIAQSLKDVAHGRVTTQEQLEKEMIRW